MADKEYQEKLIEALEEIPVEQPANTDMYTLKSGVVIRFKKFNRLILQNLAKKFKMPDPPKYWDPDRKREYPNPHDPTYLALKQQAEADQMFAAIDAAIGLGIAIEFIPATMSGPQDDEWTHDFDYLGLLPENWDASPRSRQLTWFKMVAISDDEELGMIATRLQGALGITQEMAAQAVERFRDNG